MHNAADTGIKNRLVDPAQMAKEVVQLLKSGIPFERIAVELSRSFYVDIDLLNALLNALPASKHLENQASARLEQEPLRAVA